MRPLKKHVQKVVGQNCGCKKCDFSPSAFVAVFVIIAGHRNRISFGPKDVGKEVV